MNAQVLGISVDSIDCLKAWADSLGGIDYPLLADFWPHGAVAERYGVLRPDGRSERALFVIDRQGIIRYIDIHDIDDQPSNDDLLARLRQIDPEAAAAAPAAVDEAQPPLPRDAIVLYCSSWCPDCRRARAWLRERGLAYTEVDVYANRAAAAQVRKWANGNLTTPTIDIKGTIIVDLDLERLRQVLGV